MTSDIIQVKPSRKPVSDWTQEYVNEVLFPDGLGLCDTICNYMRVQELLLEVEHFKDYHPYDEYDVSVEVLLKAYLSKFRCN